MIINCLFTKAKSSLDFVYPLVLLSKDKDIKWRLIFWRDFDEILKNDTFYRNVLLNPPANVEVIRVDKILPSIILNNSFFWGIVTRAFNILARTRTLANKLLPDELKEKFVNNLIARYPSDIYFMDHRNFGNWWGFDYFKDQLAGTDVPLVLFPHAPHHTGTDAFSPYSKKLSMGEKMDYWMPFRFDEYWKSKPELKDNFFYSGYPGLDESWIKTLDNEKKSPGKDTKILLIIRKIFPEHITEIPKGHDNYAFFYPEFVKHLKEISDTIKKNFSNYTIFIKPHPSTDQKLLKKIIFEVDAVNIQIDDNPIFFQISKYDIFLSFYTTTILIPFLACKPSFIINSRIQEEMEQWPILRDLYKKLNGFCQDTQEFDAKVKEFNLTPLEYQKNIKSDQAHIRYYYPDNSVQQILQRLEVLHEKSSQKTLK